MQVVVILQAKLLPLFKSALAKALIINKQSAERQSLIKPRQSLSLITKLSLIQIQSLHQGRLLHKPESKSMASNIGVAMRLHKRRRPIQSRRIYGVKEKDSNAQDNIDQEAGEGGKQKGQSDRGNKGDEGDEDNEDNKNDVGAWHNYLQSQ